MAAVSAVTLRGYRTADLDALHAMDVACFAPPFLFSRSAMRRFAEAVKARVVVAEVAGEVAGFCIAHVERGASGRMGYVVTLDVDPKQRERGIGRTMMDELERQCAVAGCEVMVLHVFVGNAAAIRFYERCGYALSAREPEFYGPGLDAEVWWKALGGGV